MQNVYICQVSQGSNRRATYQSHLWGYTYQDHHRGCRCTQYCDLQMTAVRWPAGYGRTVRQSQMDHSHCLCLARTMGMKDHHDPAPSPESLRLPLPSLWLLLTQSSHLKRGSPCTSEMLTKKGLEKMGVGRERKLWKIGRQVRKDPRVTAASEVLRNGSSGQNGCRWDQQPYAIVVLIAFLSVFYLQMLPKQLEIHVCLFFNETSHWFIQYLLNPFCIPFGCWEYKSEQDQ